MGTVDLFWKKEGMVLCQDLVQIKMRRSAG